MKRASDSGADCSPAKKPATACQGTWTSAPGLLLYRSEGSKLLPKLASFDLDGTLIVTKSGKRFPTGPDDWQLWSKTVPPKLRSLVGESFCIVLFSNQAGIEKAPGGGEPGFRRKIEAIVAAFNVPTTVFISTEHSFFRKPCLGGFKYLADLGKKEIGENTDAGEFFDMKNSFYVGDAAGRMAGWKAGAKADFACSDRLFAVNANLAFYTPEEFFLKQSPVPFKLPDFNPKKLEQKPATSSSVLVPNKEMVIFVGPPACGKSTFSKQFIASGRYDIASRDQLGTWQKVADAAKKSLSAGRSVVIDNTNPDVESRSRYLDIAKQLKVSSRGFLFDVPIEQARHNERFRRLVAELKPQKNKGGKPHDHVPDLAFHQYKNKFQMPTTNEGFAEVVHVKFVAEFDDPDLEKLYCSYLLEK